MTYRDRLLQTPRYRKLRESCFRLLEDEGITRYQLCKQTGIDQTRLARVYHGKVPMSMNELIRICDACGFQLELKPKNPINTGTKHMVQYLKKIFP
jgi:transcriptional regulator with XRE-family HTH domain